MTSKTILLAALLAFAGNASVVAQPKPATVDVSLANFRFTPGAIRVPAGTPVVLHLTNTSTKSHDFTAPQFFAAATIAPADRSLVKDGSIELGGGERRDIHLIARAGRYRLKCSHAFHALFGMKGEIIVA